MKLALFYGQTSQKVGFHKSRSEVPGQCARLNERDSDQGARMGGE